MDAIKTIMFGGFLFIAGCGGGGKSGGASLQTVNPKYDIASYAKSDVDNTSLSGLWMITASGETNIPAESSSDPNTASKIKLREIVSIVEQSSGIIEVRTCGNAPVSTTATGNTLSFEDDGDHVELHVISNTALEGTSVLEGSTDTLQVDAVKIANAAQVLGVMNLTTQRDASTAPTSRNIDINCLAEADIDTNYSGNGFSGSTHDHFLTVGLEPSASGPALSAFSIDQSSGTVNGKAVDVTELIASMGSMEFSAPAPDADMPVAKVNSALTDVSANYSGVLGLAGSQTINISGDFALKLP